MGTKPYTCPVCKGKTKVKKGFYPDEPERTNCKSCLNGVVYGATPDYQYIPQEPNYYQYQPLLNFVQCPACGTWYSGTHNCMGKYWSDAPTGVTP